MLTFDAAGWLWLVPLAALYVLWAARRAPRLAPSQGEGRRPLRRVLAGSSAGWLLPGSRDPQRLLQAAARAAVLFAVAAALARPAWHGAPRTVSLVYLVDVSASIPAAQVERAAGWIEAARRQRAPAHEAVIAFAADPVRLPDPAALGPLARARAAGADPDPSATNLERALDAARAAFAARHLRRIVLFSDGRETRGDAGRAAALLRADGIEIHAVPLDARDAGDAWVDAIAAPHRVAAGEPFVIGVRLVSQAARTGTVELRHRGRLVAVETVELTKGPAEVALEARLAEPGPAVIEAILHADGDPLLQNNLLRHALWVGPRRRVLYVEGHPESAWYLRTSLEAAGFDVAAIAPPALRAWIDRLDTFDAVLLSDADARAVGEESMSAVEEYVARGGGLLVAGGDQVFGRDGYAETPIERALPVRFDVREPPAEVAIVFALDRSWSMVGPTIELAREATRAALDVLADRHQAGVIAFNHEAAWVAPLQPAAGRAAIKAAVDSVRVAGQTDIYPALAAAYEALRGVPAAVRHVVLLSDGHTVEHAYEDLVRRMAADRITLSTVAVGSGANRAFMRSLAAWGRGRAYAFADARSVPQIFVSETERVARGVLDEPPTPVRIVRAARVLEGLPLPSAPPLLGYTRATIKPGADLLLATPGDDPLLARWPYGLGRAAFFAADVKDRWAAPWLQWSGYRAFWARLVRDVMRRPDDTAGLHVERVAQADGTEEIHMLLEAVDRSGRFLALGAPRIELLGDDEPRTIALRQTAPGRYEAVAAADETRDYIVGVRFDGVAALPPEAPLAAFVLAREPDELRPRPPDAERLRALARDTGGAFDPAPAEVVAPDGSASVPRPLWPWLLALAAAAYVADLFVRRVPLFERREADEAATSALAGPAAGSAS